MSVVREAKILLRFARQFQLLETEWLDIEARLIPSVERNVREKSGNDETETNTGRRKEWEIGVESELMKFPTVPRSVSLIATLG